jgi:hypothetical protein
MQEAAARPRFGAVDEISGSDFVSRCVRIACHGMTPISWQ